MPDEAVLLGHSSVSTILELLLDCRTSNLPGVRESRNLRIAIWHNLPSGGGKRALFDQVQGLTRRGHHVEVWCPPSAETGFLPLSSLVPEHVVPLGEVPPLPKDPFRKRFHYARESSYLAAALEVHTRLCGEQMRAGKFDLLLAHPCQFFHSSAAGKNSGLPSVLFLHEPNRPLYEAMPQLPWAALPAAGSGRWYRRWNLALADTLKLHSKRVSVREELAWAKSYDQILTCSLFSREGILRAYSLDSRVCYLGVDTERFRPTGSPKERLVVGLGNVGLNKRTLLAVQAVGAMPSPNRPRLVWIGNRASNEYMGEVKRTAVHLGVELDIRLLIGDEELGDLLSRAAVMIYASHLEPFGYAPLEANACGTGVVGIAEGGVRETVGHPESGVLVSNLEPSQFAKQLVRFTGDLAFASEFGRKAREHVQGQWSMKSAIDRLEAELLRIHGMIRN